MNKLELIQTLQSEAGLTKSEATKVVNIFFDEVAGALAKGDRVEIRGLCWIVTWPSFTALKPGCSIRLSKEI